MPNTPPVDRVHLSTLPVLALVAYLLGDTVGLYPQESLGSVQINVHLDGRVTLAESDRIMAFLSERYEQPIKRRFDGTKDQYDVLDISVPSGPTSVRLAVYGVHMVDLFAEGA